MGQYRSTITCHRCNFQSNSYDPFMDLSLPIPQKSGGGSYYSSYSSGSVTLIDCLEMEEEKLTDDYRCEKCKKKGHCTRKISIQKLPQVLVIHLKRFSYTAYSRKKLSTSVTFPMTGLNLSELCEDGGSSTYNLYGISHHSGYMGGGHYVADILNSDGKWYHCDDSHADASYSDPQGGGSSPYLLFYARSDLMAKL